jgi:hypothetical protein
MADLKNIDADTLIQAIRGAAEEYKAAIDRRAQEAVGEVEEAARALRLLPLTVSDLLACAEVVFVREINSRDIAPYSQEAKQMTVVLQFESNNSVLMCDYDRRPNVRPGRYRAVFALIPIGEKK